MAAEAIEAATVLRGNALESSHSSHSCRGRPDGFFAILMIGIPDMRLARQIDLVGSRQDDAHVGLEGDAQDKSCEAFAAWVQVRVMAERLPENRVSPIPGSWWCCVLKKH
jgi:hypothetical protein